jgi:microcystin degradation protein MlrC
MTKRVLGAGFEHETNTFSGLPTGLDAYTVRSFYRDDAVASKMRGTRTEIAGFLDACETYGWTPVHPVYASATPSGRVTEEVYEIVAGEITNCLERDGPFDAILLNLHGAMVCEHVDDGEGELLGRVRKLVGPDVPIAVTLDLHANVTDRMAELADVMIAYRTYPHVDQYEIATEAAALIDRTLRGEIKPKTVIARGTMLDGADYGRTTSPGPMTEVLASAAKFQSQPGVLAATVAVGFPWADIHETGPAALVVGNGDDPRYQGMADALIGEVWEKRNRVALETTTVDDALAAIAVAESAGKPIVLADFGDNPGGGGYGDSTGLLRGMIDAGLEDAVFATIYDPVSVQTCIDNGLGAQVVLALGGKIDPQFGEPIPVTGTVAAVTDGKFKLEGPMMAGVDVNMGPTVVLQVGGIRIIIASARYQAYDLMIFRHARIEPTQAPVIAVKSAHHFRAAFGPIASEIICVDAGGLTSRNYQQFTYEKVRRPIFPLDMD